MFSPQAATNHTSIDDQPADKTYFDEIYLMKQAAARRKLAYEYNQIGRVKKAG